MPHLKKWFFSYVGVKSSASSEFMSNCGAMQFSDERLLFSPFIFPSHTCATRSFLGWSRSIFLSYGTFAECISFGLAEQKPTALLLHTQLVCKALLPLSKTETWHPECGRILHSTVLLRASLSTSPSVTFKSPQSLNKCSSYTLHLLSTEPSLH